MAIRIDQIKSITLPGGISNSFWQSVTGKCAKVYNLYDILNSYFANVGYNLYTDSTLSGNGSIEKKLKIAQQGATIGQVLSWSGTSWIPADATSNQTLSYTPGVINLTSGGSINISNFISSDSPNLLGVGTDSEFVVALYKDTTLSGNGTQASPLSIAQQGATNGQVLSWNGTTWAPTSSVGGNGIYGGSGTIASNVTATLTNNSVFEIAYNGGNAAIFISDLNEIVTISSPSGLFSLSTAPTKAAITGPSGELAFNSTNTIFTDTNAGHGIQYSADLSATFQPNSLVTKQYVDGLAFAGLPSGTSAGQILYWDGADWVTAKRASNTQTNLSTSVVTIPHIPISSLPIDVYLNGVLKEITEDYTLSSNQVVFSTPIVVSDKITTKYYY